MSQNDVWQPEAPALVGQELVEAEQDTTPSVIHCWADWNLRDRDADVVIRSLRPRMSGWANFYSCNLDTPENWKWLAEHECVSIPCFYVFRAGKKLKLIIGVRDEITLARDLLNAIAPDAHPKPRGWLRYFRGTP